ncbi:MAG: 2-C-methyl-D-erythritol 2,4-cyclodiphosphate synthase [Rikenellaceae bacterium]
MKNIRIGYGYDVHRLADGLPLTIGGVRLEHTKGIVAHSDGDVLLHAICDALLGALALGDIGLHFPDTSAEFRGIDSTILLRRSYELVRAKGYVVGNIDCMLCLERPKIRPYVDSMRKRIAELLEIEIEDVSIKATTKEKLGFVGAEEGVEASATLLLFKNDERNSYQRF